MFFRKLFFLFIILLIMGALFGNGRRSEYQSGYAQGYVAGQQAATHTEEGATAVAPPAPPAYPPYHGFSFFGFLFKAFGFFFGFMLLMGLLFGCRRRKGHGRHWHKWQQEWPKSGHTPPWYGHDQADEPVMKA